MSDFNPEQLPDDLEPVAAWLRAERHQADPLTLDQIKQRAMARASHPHRRFGFVKSKIATIVTIVGLAGGTGGALAVAASSTGSTNSSAASGQYKPGWGCGDTNHTHTGPPGNTTATSPCK